MALSIEAADAVNLELVIQPASNCLIATQMLSTAIRANTVESFLAEIGEKIELKELPNTITAIKTGPAGEIVASVEIDFFGNLKTYFQGRELTIPLHNALGTGNDLLEIFMQMVNCKESLPMIEDEFSQALRQTVGDKKLMIGGKEVIALYPASGRVVLNTKRGQSSRPIEKIQNCAHLFNREFAEEIAPRLGLEPDVNSLVRGIHNIYLGRCLLGIKRGIESGRFGEMRLQRELERIISHIVMPGSAFYTEPLA